MERKDLIRLFSNIEMRNSLLIVIIHLFLFPAAALAGWEAYIVDACDGDTLVTSRNGRAEIIRLYGVDCPERDQPFGLKAQAYTTNLVVGKRAKLIPVDEGRYRRCLLYCESTCLNTKLLKDGYAWYHEVEPRHEEWTRLEERAKSLEKGLWSQDNPVPPWDFRAIAEVNEPPPPRAHTIKLGGKHQPSGVRPIAGRSGRVRFGRTR